MDGEARDRRPRYTLTDAEDGAVWGTCFEVDGMFGPSTAEARDARRWLRPSTRFVPTEQVMAPLVLRGLAPDDRLRTALTEGTRRSRTLGETVLEVRDDHGAHLANRTLWVEVTAWQPSLCGTDLTDVEIDGTAFDPVPEHARPIWERWFVGPPETLGAWGHLDTRDRWSWLALVRDRACVRYHQDRAAGRAYQLDGRYVTDEPGLHLALGEAVNGPGGYFGGDLDALVDCLRGSFGYTRPGTLLWREAATARQHLSEVAAPQGPRDLFAEVLGILTEGRLSVTLA